MMSTQSSPVWPSVTFETAAWVPLPPGTASRAQLRRHSGPYQAAITPLIRDVPLVLAMEVLAGAEEAATEIARFDAEMGGESASYASVLLRSESAASSQIEHLTASARAVAEAELGTDLRANAVRIVANGRAMMTALERAGQLDQDAVLAMHRVLMEDVDPDAGQWRQQQVWIGGSSSGPHEAIFVPPQHHRVVAAMSDLVAFIRRDGLPVLPHAAIAHAQFETIHPFTDGNGRTGRAMAHAMLSSSGLTRSVTVPVSAGLLTDTDGYFAALEFYREGDPRAIVEQFCWAVFSAIHNGRRLVSRLREIRAGWDVVVQARQSAITWQVADLLVRHPVINAPFIAEQLEMPASNVYRALAPLEQAGVVASLNDRHRNRVWRAPQILDAIDAFAARAGRRG